MTNQSKNSKRKTQKGGHEVGYGKPPVDGQFKKGQSGNPRGRPKSSTSRRAILERLMGKKQRLDNQPRGARVWFSRLELLVMTCKQMAVSGHLQATKLLDDISARFGPQDSQHSGHGFLIVPQKLTEEEWVAKYSPKDDPPDLYEYDDD